jgi:hypothetical protein
MSFKNPATLQGVPLPSIPAPFSMPFYYAFLGNCVVHYLVDYDKVLPYMAGTGLTAANFGGKASVSYDFQVYGGQSSSGVGLPPEQWGTSAASLTQEIELNIVAFPEGKESELPEITFEQWVMGDDQTKLLGNRRVWVPCDNPFAIQAGEELFGEPKFQTTFKVNIPSYSPVRLPGDEYQIAWVKTWGFRTNDPDDSSKWIFTFIGDLDGLTSVPGNISPITEYGRHPNSDEGRPTACRWNILQPLDTYFLSPDDQSRIDFQIGDSPHPMAADMRVLLAGEPVVAVQTLISAPAAIQSRAVYL